MFSFCSCHGDALWLVYMPRSAKTPATFSTSRRTLSLAAKPISSISSSLSYTRQRVRMAFMVLSCVEAGRRPPVRVADFEITPGATGSGHILTSVAAAEAPGWVA